MKVKSLMSETPYCCQQSETARHAAQLMRLHDVGSIPVVDNYDERKLVGIVTDRDICLQIAATGKVSDSVRVGDIMSEFPLTCRPDDSIDVCESIMEKQQVRRVPVVDQDGRCIGIVSLADIARHDSNKHTACIVAAISQRSEVASIGGIDF